MVEEYAQSHPERIAIAHSPVELDALLGAGRPALIHCVEGGFALGDDALEVHAHVAALARSGVAYITVAHLFWREVATNAPALPFLPDRLYHRVFPQPDRGLTPLGRSLVEAMVDAGILVDITHMSAPSRADTFALLDELDPQRRVPLIATHMACRFGELEFCLDDESIRRVAQRGGVLGCIMCEHFITDGLPGPHRSFEDSVRALQRHIDHVGELTGSCDHIAIGSDLDGYIKPALCGLEHMGRMSALQRSLRERYGAQDADKICAGNALRVLRGAWQQPRRPQ